MKKSLCRIIFLVVILFSTGCQGFATQGSPAASQPAAWPAENWQTSTPEQQGMDSGKLADLFAAIETQQIPLHSLLVLRNGYLVVEAYFPPYTRTVRHTVQSNTKSVLGTLIGIAIDQGKIKNTGQKLVEFFPERSIANLDERKKEITLTDLLTMTSGLDCKDGEPSLEGMFQTQDWVQYMLDRPMAAAPGEQWVYCSGASHLLSAILQEATGMDARTFANRYLFQPLGIPEVTAADWGSDPQGVTEGLASLYLTPGELARYGYLYLNRGRWDGKQVIAEKWVEQSTAAQVTTGDDPIVGGQDRRFGYMFSVFPELKYYGYLGRAGQELYVLPDKNMVVVFTASTKVGEEPALLKLVNDYILPAARSEKPLPASAEATARLQGTLDSINDPKQPLPPSPQTEAEISGKTYQLEENTFGWSSMTFTFQPGAEEAALTVGDAPELKIGLDHVYRKNEIPDGRPVGLRGAWKSADEFQIEFVTLGDFVETEATAKFEGDELTLSVLNRNFDDPPLLLHGTLSN